MKSPRAAFTLLEIIAVIAIISLLAILSLGAIERARDSAQRAKTVSNMRAILAAAGSYASENAGMIVPNQNPASIWGSDMRTWQIELGALLGQAYGQTPVSGSAFGTRWGGKRPPGVFADPASKDLMAPGNPGMNLADFGKNVNACGGRNVPDGDFRATVRYSQITSPTKLFLIFPTVGLNSDVGWWNLGTLRYGRDGKVPIGFLDGHVEVMAREELEKTGAAGTERNTRWFGQEPR